MSDQHIRAIFVSVRCLLRGLPLFFSGAPKTPLRVLGIVALDVLHVLRHAKPLPRQRLAEVAMLMDFEGCTNAAWDHKGLCQSEYEVLKRRLGEAGLGACVDDYLDRLRELESRRPSIDGDLRRFAEARSYREEVVRLSLAAVTAIALHAERLDAGIRATHCDRDVETLFRIAMQCQIIDDVLDYRADRAAGLPSFLTASASLSQALALTATAARAYAASPERSSGNSVLPFRMALSVISTMTRLIVRVAISRHAQRLLNTRDGAREDPTSVKVRG